MSAAVSMFRAEWLKISGNRWTTAFLVWIFPVGAMIVMSGAFIIALLSSEFRTNLEMQGIAPWNDSILFSWGLINNPFLGRPIILIFTAIVFAGEYQNGTWKNLIPLRTRVALILNKFVTVSVFVTFAFVLMTIIVGVGTGLVAGVAGIDYGVGNVSNVLGDFLSEYFLQMFYVLAGTFLAACFAALAAMLTRSVVASSIVAILAYFFELLGVFLFFALVSFLTGWELFMLYRYFPSFNLENIMSWVRFDQGLPFLVEDVSYAPISLTGSLLIVSAWVVVLVTLTIWRFQRQDITT